MPALGYVKYNCLILSSSVYCSCNYIFIHKIALARWQPRGVSVIESSCLLPACLLHTVKASRSSFQNCRTSSRVAVKTSFIVFDFIGAGVELKSIVSVADSHSTEPLIYCLDLFFFRKTGNLANRCADIWNGFCCHCRYRSNPLLGVKNEAEENKTKWWREDDEGQQARNFCLNSYKIHFLTVLRRRV